MCSFYTVENTIVFIVVLQWQTMKMNVSTNLRKKILEKEDEAIVLLIFDFQLIRFELKKNILNRLNILNLIR